jgi:hypothetical protein
VTFYATDPENQFATAHRLVEEITVLIEIHLRSYTARGCRLAFRGLLTTLASRAHREYNVSRAMRLRDRRFF